MFEDQNQKAVDDIFSDTDATAAPSPAAPLGPPSALSQGKLQPVQSSQAAQVVPSPQLSGTKVGFPFKKVIIISLVSLFLIGGASGAFYWWRNRGEETITPSLGAPVVQTPPAPLVEEPKSEEPKDANGNFVGNKLDETYSNLNQGAVNKALDPFATPENQPDGQTNSNIPPASGDGTTDTDQDGLTDSQEFTLGTNPRLVDSDGDGLSDWEELSIFGTDPLKVDTDNDKYPDGEEVQNGYNPKGPGKLLDFDKAKGAGNQ